MSGGSLGSILFCNTRNKPDGLDTIYTAFMAGRVWQWTNEGYARYPSTEQIDPGGPSSGSDRVLRGGARGFGVRYPDSVALDFEGPGNCFFSA